MDATAESPMSRKRSRSKLKKACWPCSKAKKKCDEGRPCQACIRRSIESQCLDCETKSEKAQKQRLQRVASSIRSGQPTASKGISLIDHLLAVEELKESQSRGRTTLANSTHSSSASSCFSGSYSIPNNPVDIQRPVLLQLDHERHKSQPKDQDFRNIPRARVSSLRSPIPFETCETRLSTSYSYPISTDGPDRLFPSFTYTAPRVAPQQLVPLTVDSPHHLHVRPVASTTTTFPETGEEMRVGIGVSTPGNEPGASWFEDLANRDTLRISCTASATATGTTHEFQVEPGAAASSLEAEVCRPLISVASAESLSRMVPDVSDTLWYHEYDNHGFNSPSPSPRSSVFSSFSPDVIRMITASAANDDEVGFPYVTDNLDDPI